MIALRPIRAADADALYALVAGSSVTDTILWDGPSSLDELRRALTEREAAVAAGALQQFTIFADTVPVGTIDVRPENDFRGNMGLWIGAAFHGRGIGTDAVAQAARYAFDHVGLAKLEANVFVGNIASRRIFEKNHFQLEGTIRRAVRKRGRLIDEWLFGLLREELRR